MVRFATFVSGVAFATGAVAQTAVPIAVPEADLLALVFKAHPVVQGVMALLAMAVFIVLTVMIYKLAELTAVFARLREAQKALSGGLSGPRGDSALAFAARAAEMELADMPTPITPGLRISARERLDLTLERIDAGAIERLRFGTGVLASIGTVGPFVGLFGTVFGIMNSFLAIAATKTTNLAIVAPGIAEALLATGLGLVAAIPAVILYNHLTRRIKAYRHRLADGLAEVLRQFSRAMDARMEL